MKEMEDKKFHKTFLSKTWHDTVNNIVRTETKVGAKYTLEIVKEEKVCLDKINSDKKLPVLIDMKFITSISSDAREFYKKFDKAPAVALLVESPMSKLIGNFFTGLNSVEIPLKLYTKEEEAIKWLKQISSSN